MKKCKIKYYEASAIAEAVAKKAFEHLTKSHQDALEIIGKEIYNDIDKMIDLQLLQRLGYAIPYTSFSVNINHPNNEDIRYIKVNGSFICPAKYDHAVTFIDKIIWEQADKIYDDLNPLIKKQQALQMSIQTRLTDKLTTTVAKTWPELIPFINDYYGCPNEDTELIVPFENLLRQFLPMLPAPKENENGSSS